MVYDSEGALNRTARLRIRPRHGLKGPEVDGRSASFILLCVFRPQFLSLLSVFRWRIQSCAWTVPSLYAIGIVLSLDGDSIHDAGGNQPNAGPYTEDHLSHGKPPLHYQEYLFPMRLNEKR